MLNPMQYSIYKGMGGKNGAVQFNFQPPHFYQGKTKDYTGDQAFEVVEGRRRLKDGWSSRDGAVFVEITSTKEGQKNVYDWENKVIVALSPDDMGRVLETLLTGKECKLMHDPGAKSESAGAVKKYMNVVSPDGTKVGCIIKVAKQVGDQRVAHSVPVSASELIVLRTLLITAISKALNW